MATQGDELRLEDKLDSPGLDSPTSPSAFEFPSPSEEEPTPSSTSHGRPPLPSPAASISGMTPSSTPLSALDAARRPAPPQSTLSGLPADMQARMKAFHLTRQRAPPAVSMRNNQSFGQNTSSGSSSPQSPSAAAGGVPSSFRPLPGVSRPMVPTHQSSPAVVRGHSQTKPSLAEKRGLVLPGGMPSNGPPGSPALGGRKKPGLTLSQMQPAQNGNKVCDKDSGSLLDKYSDFIDKNTGSLKFKGKAVLTSQGVEFTGGKTFNISLDEVDTLDELGKGNYGTVYKVRHSRPRMRRPGLGLAGNKALPGHQVTDQTERTPTPTGSSGVIMAMKEIRLELDDAKFAAIIMELDILHRCVSPYIVDFYGAFFQEGAVYICLEFMDGGSIDKLYAGGISESVLRKIAYSTVVGLKSLKDEHNIIHRDVKPTNILVNTKGQIKICDFGVSGNLVASIAKTNIGCQSYMAPERISSGGVAQAGANPGGGTYSVQSDIWSLGLSIIECALGRYPYPPETYGNIFSQLSAIVDGDPPDLPADGFSDAAHNFVSGCLMKIPKLRPTYAMLLQHAWLAPLAKPETITEEDEEEAELGAEVTEEMKFNTTPLGGAQANDAEVAQWAIAAIERRRNAKGGKAAQPALHAAPLDAVPSSAA